MEKKRFEVLEIWKGLMTPSLEFSNGSFKGQ